jgi:tetratricopeptide (TPR) repeat protein
MRTMDTTLNRATDDLVALLEDGVRYDRSGVSSRARACFVEVTERWRENPAAAAEAWWRLANLQRLQSQWDDALESARASALLAREHALRDVEADALNIEALVWSTRGDDVRAQALFERMLEIATAPATRAKALQNLGGLVAERREFEAAEKFFSDSRAEYRVANDARGEACSLLNIGRLQMERGDPEIARGTLETAVRESRAAGDLEMHAAALLNLGMALGELGLIAEAEERITTAYGQFTIADIAQQRVRCLIQLAAFAVRRGEAPAALVCLVHARKVATRSELPRELRLIEEQFGAVAALEASGRPAV